MDPLRVREIPVGAPGGVAHCASTWCQVVFEVLREPGGAAQTVPGKSRSSPSFVVRMMMIEEGVELAEVVRPSEPVQRRNQISW